ncbi:MAG: NUDIX hydrolase [Chloroflexi bacterium]|nr:NUDIX hydrolase [Chloroflexota bacterium]
MAQGEREAGGGERDIIAAAGGIVWRLSAGQAEILLVHRRRYGGDWALPKGKLRPGETWEQAALREVQEETGCRVELGPFVGAVTYPVDGAQKVVRFWHMRCLGGAAISADDEVIETAWLSPQKALDRMTYATERDLLRAALDAGQAYIRQQEGVGG